MLRLWILASALWLLPAAAAGAASARIVEDCDRNSGCFDTVHYRAAPGERLDVRVSDGAAGVAEQAVIIEEAGAPVTAGRGCAVVAAGSLRCTTLPGHRAIWDIQVRGAGRADRIDGSGLTDTEVPLELYGGAGADTLIGGAGTNTLSGGPGSDVLDGGAGRSTATYRDHRAGVRGDLVARTVIGARGERDRLMRVQNLIGGKGDDRLLGDRGPNSLYGAAGNDVVRGRGGKDILGGGHGADRLDGGASDDRLGLIDAGDGELATEDEGRGPDRHQCGPGTDRVSVSGRRPIIDDSCERLALLTGEIRLQLGHRDPARARIFIPLDFPSAPFQLTATLTASATDVLLGVRRRRVTKDYDPRHAALAPSAAGARYIARTAPLNIVLAIRQRQSRRSPYSERVMLHVDPH